MSLDYSLLVIDGGISRSAADDASVNPVLYDHMIDYLSKGYAVIYIASNQAKAIQKMMKAKTGLDIEEYIERRALILIDPKLVFCRSGNLTSSACEILRSLRSIMQKTISKHSRIVIIYSVNDLPVHEKCDDVGELTYERLIPSKICHKGRIEIICCYDSRSFESLSLGKTISVLGLYNYTIHSNCHYCEWHPEIIIELIAEGLNRALGQGAAQLIFTSLKWIYRIDEDSIISQPEVFEEKLRRVLGGKADIAIRVILDEIRSRVAFSAG